MYVGYDMYVCLVCMVCTTDGAEVISGRFDVGRALDFTTSFFLLLGNKIWCKKQGTTFAELKKTVQCVSQLFPTLP